jgi:chemotaxis signal transduction protein
MTTGPSRDWAAVRAVLEERLAALDRGPGPETVHALRLLRAGKLRRRPLTPEDSAAGRPFLIFRLAGRRYGIDLGAVVEIVAAPPCAPVPGAPDKVAGVMQLRGEIRPVFELTRILGLPDLDPGEPYVVLIVRHGIRQAGLRASRAESIRTFPASRIEPMADPRAAGRTADLITILNLNELLKEEG